ncbi:putative insertion element HTH domain-containing protein [Paenibacillus sp. BK033]|uniref:phBC6A51 family helix-turn-helix protein n=1 Tax=Paenibacillus sp. BK033 TaxID=2512133 RepID=UPI0010537002|nr:phBC6A51 family helix-turn-helix protein [Paenibacillus sp. BK033]TCM89612.1 putative insertion element HTH domain-containing protein [Paenibacillus sp. BK033]
MAKLNAEQMIAIEWLSIPRRGGKTYAEVAAICGVTDRTLENWRKDPTFDRELKRAMIRNNSDKLPELVESIVDIAIQDRNAAMAKLALQVNDMLTDRVEVETKDSASTDIDALKERIEALKQRKSETAE